VSIPRGGGYLSIYKGVIKILGIAAIAYVIGGVAYWTTAEVFIRIVGRNVVFSPIISILLVVPFWPMMVYADLKWIGIMAHDIAAVSATPISIFLLIGTKLRNLKRTKKGIRSSDGSFG
jgi:hypothetical protein